MKSRPILFSAPMVRAILDGSKTQTRCIIKPQPDSRPGMECTRLIFKDRKGNLTLDEALESPKPRLCAILCPYGQPGDQLWVRETWRGVVNIAPPGSYEYAVARYVPDQQHCRRVEYAASKTKDSEPWRPSIHMPRWASRITLEITDVRVERLQDIGEEDAIAEGCSLECMTPTGDDSGSAIYGPGGYLALWESINGAGSWDLNPWVWVVSFKRIDGGVR